MSFFGFTLHRGACRCPNYPKCAARFDDLLRERNRTDFMERLWLQADKKAATLNKLGQRIAAQRRQIGRLKAALSAKGGPGQ